MEKLKQVAEEIGAEKNSLLLPKELVGNPKLEGFLNWLATDTRRLHQQSKDYQSMYEHTNPTHKEGLKQIGNCQSNCGCHVQMDSGV